MNKQNNEEEINKKRKNFRTCSENLRGEEGEGEGEGEDDDNFLELKLMSSFRSIRPRIQPPENPSSLLPPPNPSYLPQLPQVAILTSTVPKNEAGHAQVQSKRRRRKAACKANAKVMVETITPPFPWATNSLAMVHTLEYLFSKQLFIISGDVQCKRCERKYNMEFDLKEKFFEIGSYIAENKIDMRERAPDIWMNPLLPTCQFCKQENSVKPIVSADKRNINWLFLLLGQMLGCCTLDELKFFCEHTNNHRTGAKDRVLFLTYLTLCKQLDPIGPFDR
ncbi:uncharacterized protein LOC129881868 [Solanum dulcamara]|uniref:uncharacterized protein LOC129881868 n=1 Tax=Solanum dulcamara TaxID=45834 RepID=UPI00248557DE|nr:uncharacterized protein LOC129881868 [Solanum dulcamara]